MKKILVFTVLVVLISVNYFPNSVGGEAVFNDSNSLENDDGEKNLCIQNTVTDGWSDDGFSFNNWKYGGKRFHSEYILSKCNERFVTAGLSAGLPNTIWSKTYGDLDFHSFSVRQTADEGYILAGATATSSYPDQDAFLIKTDRNGTMEWERYIGGEYADWANSVIVCSDGGYLATGGDCYTTKDGLQDVFLLKTDEHGNEVWYKTFIRPGRTRNSWGHCVIEVTDGYVVLANLPLYGATERSTAWLIKTDKNGNELWNKTYSGKSHDDGNWLIQADDGGLVFTGQTCSYDVGMGDIWLVKTDSEGNELWNRSYGGHEWDLGEEVMQTDDGGFVIVGDYHSDACLIKTDSSGNQEWMKRYGGGDVDGSTSFTKTADGGYVITGSTHSGYPSSQGWILVTDGNGTLLCDYVIGGPRARDVIQADDGSFVFTGYNNGIWLANIENFENEPPARPSSVYNSSRFVLTVFSTDPDGDRIRYGVSWGDGTEVDKWTEYYESGEQANFDCFLRKKPISVIAEDEYGARSEWVGTKAKIPDMPLLRFLYQLFSLFFITE